MAHPSLVRRFVWLVVAGVLIGGLYSELRHGTPATGAAVGASMAASLFALQRVFLRDEAVALFRWLPFLPYFGLRRSGG